MQLKEYQRKVVNSLEKYLDALVTARDEYDKTLAAIPDAAACAIVAEKLDFTEQAWGKVDTASPHHPHKNGIGEPLPDMYIKVPTGGGKTLLACCAVEEIQRRYLVRQTGLVLWIVPSVQIYRQTRAALSDRNHPYRYILDRAAGGGRVRILEKTDQFAPEDLRDQLVVMMLMLPAANRQTKETLRMFKDTGGFERFFPPEDAPAAHEKLRSDFPNLDVFTDAGGLCPLQIKSSLGNVVRISSPLIVMDEGQKAYSALARETLYGFNPAFVLELSATPPPKTNVLIKVSGRELDHEEMIKLDINLANPNTTRWGDVLAAAAAKQRKLEYAADHWRQSGGDYIRPIVLIQVERTGADQRGGGRIHAEDARKYLIERCNVAPEHIAVKSSEKDEIEKEDLLSEYSAIRYIITKSALQEGWDCAFAYVLAVLSNSTSDTAMTQLVGRILRQPNARKTGKKELDECYVFTHRESTSSIVGKIQTELEKEGLGDIAGHIAQDSGGGGNGNGGGKPEKVIARLRPQFRKFKGRIYLPQFMFKEKGKWREVDYEADIIGGIDWDALNLTGIKTITLGEGSAGKTVRIGLPENKTEDGDELPSGIIGIDEEFMTRQFAEIVPNGWRAYEITERTIAHFLRVAKGGKGQGKSDKAPRDRVTENFVFIIREVKKVLEAERDRLAEQAFRRLVESGAIRFLLLAGKGGYKIPASIPFHDNKKLIREDRTPIQRSLFDHLPESEFDSETEKAVALYLDEQEKLLWWHRNLTNGGYRIQGWKRHRIYPDFIAAGKGKSGAPGRVYVLETKGAHLQNEDTDYKQAMFEVCNKNKMKSETWGALKMDFPAGEFVFRIVREDKWKSVINALFHRD